jgi:hypothetical protein
MAAVDQHRLSGYQDGVHAMRIVGPKVVARAVRLAITLATSSLLSVFAPGHASAGFCSATQCSLTLTNSNFAGTGTFGTVTLSLSAHVVTVDVMLASAYRIIVSGNGGGNPNGTSPGAVGFSDNIGGNLTIGNFKSGGVATSLYSGSKSSAPGCNTSDCHWNLFGYANDAAATNGPKRPQSLEELSFTVSKGASITDVHQLLQKSIPSGGNPSAYFIVDACIWDLKKSTCGNTGLFAVTRVPEPGSLALLASGLLALGFLRWKRAI